MSTVRIRRPASARSLISLVSMIDVMMILLFFFMVTSTYLDLDMVPAVQQADETTEAPPPTTAPGTPPGTDGAILVRIGADGGTVVGGTPLTLDALSDMIRARLSDAPLTPVVLLPSGGADMQALISVMDRLTLAGVQRLRVIRLEAQP